MQFITTAIPVFISFSLIALWLLAGDLLPIPWPDELHFLLPAIQLSENGSLAHPALHPERALFWMPPGYYFILAPVVKVFGNSLMAARVLSLACLLGVFWSSLYITNKLRVSRFSQLVLGLCFLIPGVMVASNFVRMDALQVLLSFLVLCFVINRRFDLAFPLALLSGLVHYNAIYTLAPVMIIFGLSFFSNFTEKKNLRVLPKDLGVKIFWLLSIGLGIWYAYYVGSNWASFSQDMQMQFLRKMNRMPFYLNFKYMIPTFCGFGVASIFFWNYAKKLQKRSFESLTVVLFSLFWILVFSIGQEMTYYIWLLLGLALISIITFEYWDYKFRFFRFGILMLPFLIGVALTKGKGYVYSGMKLVPFQSYLSEQQFEDISNTMGKVGKESETPKTILIEPSGVGVYFMGVAKQNGLNLVVNTPVYQHEKIDYRLCIFNAKYSPAGMVDRLKNVCPDFQLTKNNVFKLTRLR